jgi:hypothetical protein
VNAIKRAAARLAVSVSLAAASVTAVSVIAAPAAHATGQLAVCGWVLITVNNQPVYVPVSCPGPCGIDQGPNEIGGWPVDVRSWECVLLP